MMSRSFQPSVNMLSNNYQYYAYNRGLWISTPQSYFIHITNPLAFLSYYTWALDMAPDRASGVSVPLTVSTTASTTAPGPGSPSNPDISRPRLKEITKWIRDELDLQVAREGPGALQPDDVVTLHEIFQGLQHAKGISTSDLRATGIHRAIQDIAGVATRWPGRLCDDCDKIIDIWSAKFGPLNGIHPFLYGRGGRLEGIASVHEQSRDVALRPAASCLG